MAKRKSAGAGQPQDRQEAEFDLSRMAMRDGRRAAAQALKLAEVGVRPGSGRDGHRVSLWQRGDGKIVVALRIYQQGQEVSGLCHVNDFPDREQAVRWIEAHDPLQHLQPDFDALDPALSPVAVTLHAAALRQRADRLLQDWRALTGELFFELGRR